MLISICTTNTRLNQLCSNKTTPRNRDVKEIMGYRNVLNIIHENEVKNIDTILKLTFYKS